MEGRTLGYIEIDTALARPERHARAAGLADIGNLCIDPAQHGTGLEHWLLARAADRLRLCGVDRLVAYESAADTVPRSPSWPGRAFAKSPGPAGAAPGPD